jgi:hypothetical protein
MESSEDTNPSGLIRVIKRFGFWGFLFFFVKGLLWLLVPALIAWLSMG